MATKDADVYNSPPFFVASGNLDDGDTLVLQPGNVDVDRAVVHVIHHDGSCDVKVYHDADDDNNTYERVVTSDSLSGTGVSQGNEIELTASQMKLEITDTSAGTDNDYIITGEME